jgi:hypothetical protein
LIAAPDADQREPTSLPGRWRWCDRPWLCDAQESKRASHIDPPASSYAIMRRAGPYRGENRGPGEDVEGELEPRPGIREQSGSLTAWPPTGACSMSALKNYRGEITELAKQDSECERLMGIPGIGPLISSAMVAAIGPATSSPKAAILLLGLASCPNRSPPVTAPSLAPWQDIEEEQPLSTHLLVQAAGSFL